MEIIVMSGFAGSGKDTAADVLVEEFDFIKASYADSLREALYTLNPMVSFDAWQITEKYGPPLAVYLQDVIDEFGWQGYKTTEYNDEIRRLIQTLGTEVGRGMLGQDVWVDALYNSLPQEGKVVIPDGRFYNEFEAARKRGGFVWRIDRDGVGPANDHSSETEAVDYPHFSLFLKNNGTVEQFREMVYNEYRTGRFREWGI